MRGLVISDTHGRHRTFDLVVEAVGKIDFLIHLGDTEGGEDYIEASVDCPCYIVAGNNDFFSDLQREREVTLQGCRMFLTHGHAYQVSLGPERIIDEGRARGCDVVMFGHTHKPYHYEKDGLLVLNPGNIALPRQEGRKESYIILEIDEAGKVSWEQCYWE